MKKPILSVLLGTVGGVILATQVAGPLVAQEAASNSSVYEQLDLFGDVFERIRSQYVEAPEDQKLIEAAINGMLSSLDPHSSYLPPEAFADMRETTRGEFGGLGIEVSQEEGYIKVVSPIDGTPAAEAGIQPGDFITQVDGENIYGLPLDDAITMMRGPVGSEIVITVVREGVDQPFDVTIVRDTIKIAAVKARAEDHSVVLRITTFSDQTFSGVTEGIDKIVAELGGIDKVDGFVLDLRNNPGGLLNQAIAVSDAFLDKGEIVSTRGRNPQDSERFNAEPGDLAQGKPIVILINGGSASASEIVTGALQDHHRAIVVGTKSFGKGSVQTIVPLKGDAAMRLTTARYYTPSGRSIQALGISPDIIVEQPPPVVAAEGEDTAADEASRNQRSEADLRGILSNDSMTEDEIKQLEEERAQEAEAHKRRLDDFQMSFAIDLIRGLKVVSPQE
ncbi:MAG: S41 family peptidase [Paracoccaceae bacterium]